MTEYFFNDFFSFILLNKFNFGNDLLSFVQFFFSGHSFEQKKNENKGMRARPDEITTEELVVKLD